ncbi:hypothetical protein NVP1286O_75 [Vibrio phage 1.286.O._10N.286.55.C4]|nr:hypothetical protein NVP1286O_75 [Vibrio phage 1.286.O._10N.286.55.C4]
MYKLAKFRKGLKEKSYNKVRRSEKKAIRDFKFCFYIKAYPDSHVYIGRSLRVRWDKYYALKSVIKNNKSPCFGWAHAKEGIRYGQ